VLGVPASVGPFVTTSLLSWKGKLRAAAEPFLPRTDPDDSIGTHLTMGQRTTPNIEPRTSHTADPRSSIGYSPYLGRTRHRLSHEWRVPVLLERIAYGSVGEAFT